MAYERILDSVLWFTRVWNTGILYVAYSYLTYVNVEVSGKTEMQLIRISSFLLHTTWYQVPWGYLSSYPLYLLL